MILQSIWNQYSETFVKYSGMTNWAACITSTALPYKVIIICNLTHWTWDQTVATVQTFFCHDDVIKWKHFPRYWPFVRGIHRSVNSPHKGQWRGALMFTLICARIIGWVNNREAGDLRRHRAHYDVTVMFETHFDWQYESICFNYSLV